MLLSGLNSLIPAFWLCEALWSLLSIFKPCKSVASASNALCTNTMLYKGAYQLVSRCCSEQGLEFDFPVHAEHHKQKGQWEWLVYILSADKDVCRAWSHPVHQSDCICGSCWGESSLHLSPQTPPSPTNNTHTPAVSSCRGDVYTFNREAAVSPWGGVWSLVEMSWSNRTVLKAVLCLAVDAALPTRPNGVRHGKQFQE